MIGDLLSRLHKILTGHKSVFFLSLVFLVLFLAFGISRLRVTESIFATLPKGKSFEEFNRLIETKNIINQIVFSIQIPKGSTTDDARSLAQAFSDSLAKDTKGLVANVQYERPYVQEDLYQYAYVHFPELIDSSYYQYIAGKIRPDSVRKSVAAAHKQLLTPGGSFLKQFVINDPLGLTGPYFRSLNADNNAGGIMLEDGLMFSDDRRTLLILASTSYDSGNSDQNVALFNLMEVFQAKWNAHYRKHHFSYFGTFEISARNAVQVKQDSYFTSIVALALISLLLVLYYRKLLIPLYLILPGLFGAVFALGITGYIRPEVSGISLATGAVIFGILLDYAFHFFTHLRHTRSISQAIQEVSAPLLTGSFTTVMAFGALTFANSAVLRDFGFFASLALLGAAIFTLVALPVILDAVGFDYRKAPEIRFFAFPVLPKYFKKGLAFVVVILTGVFLYYSQFTRFDSALENLSIQNADLSQREEQLTGINPLKEKRLYVFASSPSQGQAVGTNYEIYQRLARLRQDGRISNFVSSGTFLIPPDITFERSRRWHAFWNIRTKEKTFASLDRAASENGFNAFAFNDFKQWIARQNASPVPLDTIFSELGISNFIDARPNKTTLISTLIVPNEQLSNVKSELRSVRGAELFDRGELAGELLNLVKKDFNYLLLVSAGIVFLTLLIVYGRIELTLLSFLPMVVSWIWILGIAALLDIRFNFVNVIVTTFIFGLGDDFSIFVTDGLLSKYKYGKDTLRSYQSAITLSALTTIIGTGALIFAKHPAIHSVALISVLGIVCILFISFVVQPVLFGFFVSQRVKRKKAPVTMLPFILSILSFIYFLFGCLFLQLILVLIRLLPIAGARRKALLNRSVVFFAKTVIYSGPHVKKRFSGLENLDTSRPAIMIANHTSFLDILLAIMLSPKIVLMVKGWVYHSPFFGPVIRYAGYIYTDDGPEQNMAKMRELVANGYSLLVFPEGTRSDDGHIGRFHKGAFHLASELGLDIQPVLIHGAADVLPKNDFLIRPGALHVHVLPRINPNAPEWGNQLRDQTKNISNHFKKEFAAFKDKMEDTDYLRHKIFTNYVFKGPVLEWYFKIKWRLESVNFAHYNQLVGPRENILDLGCGYGYLSFYLHYKNENRRITGIDYDEEKITIAQHSYHKSDRLDFIQADITEVDFDQKDVIFLNDVLHYLPREKQALLLEKCALALLPEGIIFIRDGITDQSEKHRQTLASEALSTGVFSFNKKENHFHFFSSDEIYDFARKHGMSCEMQPHSRKTSNVLFVLRADAVK